ncbi:hypothetical protein GWA97_13005 [Flavobacterium sp. LaA7.5]|nr:hypothetical protein [Flavobacterium salilacus subsp. altitudinum]
MKNLKNSLIACVITITSITMFTVSCSKDENVTEKESVVFQQKSLALQKGDKIAEIDVNGDYVFTVSKEDLITEFENASGDNEYKYSDVEIVKIDVDGDGSDIEYLLVATSFDMTVKTAVQITYSIASNSFQLNNSFSLAKKITCTSTCQFGCTPTILRNPAGQKEVTCIACSNGHSCTKSVSL